MERIKNAKGNCRHGMSHPNYQLAYFNFDILLFLLIGYVVIVLRLRCKMIYKIQLIGNKQVTLFVKLNR